jgi:colanic acid/amylovoran biosynthesis glycosyltransferase
MKLAYLINQYPQPSQSFIRREIVALEQLGIPVSRFTLRRYRGPLADPADQAEQKKTLAVLDQGIAALLLAVCWAFLNRPSATIHAFLTARRSSWEASRSPYVRIAYFVEACFLARHFHQEAITHVHVHFGTNSTAVALLVRLLGGPSYSFTCHGPEEFDRMETLALGAKIHHASFAVAISDFGRSQLYRCAEPNDWDKIHVVHCGVDESFLASNPTPVPSNHRLLCIGRLSEQKGQLTLLEAIARVVPVSPDLELLLVGDGPMRPQLEQAISRLNLENSVRLIGWKSGQEIRDLLISSRAMVLPSFAEGLPVVIMESFALGRPVISTSVMGIPELVRHKETGWLVPPANPERLAAAIIECLDADPAILTRMGAAGRSLVTERHAALREAERLLGLICRTENEAVDPRAFLTTK